VFEWKQRRNHLTARLAQKQRYSRQLQAWAGTSTSAPRCRPGGFPCTRCSDERQGRCQLQDRVLLRSEPSGHNRYCSGLRRQSRQAPAARKHQARRVPFGCSQALLRSSRSSWHRSHSQRTFRLGLQTARPSRSLHPLGRRETDVRRRFRFALRIAHVRTTGMQPCSTKRRHKYMISAIHCPLDHSFMHGGLESSS